MRLHFLKRRGWGEEAVFDADLSMISAATSTVTGAALSHPIHPRQSCLLEVVEDMLQINNNCQSFWFTPQVPSQYTTYKPKGACRPGRFDQ